MGCNKRRKIKLHDRRGSKSRKVKLRGQPQSGLFRELSPEEAAGVGERISDTDCLLGDDQTGPVTWRKWLLRFLLGWR
jgi:hypothetical protein